MIKNHPHLAKLLHEDALLPLGLKVTEAAHRLGISRTAMGIEQSR